MLHRCAFDARSSVALSAHPWNLPYHSRAILSRAFFRTHKIASTSDFCLLSLARRGADSLSTLLSTIISSFPAPHHPPLYFPMQNFSSQHFRFSGMSEKEKKFRCAAFEWNEKFFFRERKIIQKRKQKAEKNLKCSWRHSTKPWGENRCEHRNESLFCSPRNEVKVSNGFM